MSKRTKKQRHLPTDGTYAPKSNLPQEPHPVPRRGGSSSSNQHHTIAHRPPADTPSQASGGGHAGGSGSTSYRSKEDKLSAAPPVAAVVTNDSVLPPPPLPLPLPPAVATPTSKEQSSETAEQTNLSADGTYVVNNDYMPGPHPVVATDGVAAAAFTIAQHPSAAGIPSPAGGGSGNSTPYHSNEDTGAVDLGLTNGVVIAYGTRLPAGTTW